MFGAKDTKALDRMYGKSKGDIPGVTRERTREECIEASVKAGYAERWSFVDEGDDSWKKIIPVSDEAKQAMINERRKGILENANFTLSARSGDAEAAIIQKYVILNSANSADKVF